MLFITLAVYVFGLPMRETYKPIILKRRAKKLGITPPQSNHPGASAVKSSLVQNFLRPIHMLFTEVGPSNDLLVLLKCTDNPN